MEDVVEEFFLNGVSALSNPIKLYAVKYNIKTEKLNVSTKFTDKSYLGFLCSNSF